MQNRLKGRLRAPAKAGASACRVCDTLQGEPISARSCATEIPSPWYLPGDKIERRTAHSAQRASHTLCAQFPCRCPDRTHMSSGRDFFDSLERPRKNFLSQKFYTIHPFLYNSLLSARESGRFSFCGPLSHNTPLSHRGLVPPVTAPPRGEPSCHRQQRKRWR